LDPTLRPISRLCSASSKASGACRVERTGRRPRSGGDGVPMASPHLARPARSSLTAARSADEDGRRCVWLITGNARNNVLGGGEMAGYKPPVRLRLRVHGASIGLLEDGRAPCVMRYGITFDCRPFVHVVEQRVASPRTRSFHGKEGVIGSSPIEGFVGCRQIARSAPSAPAAPVPARGRDGGSSGGCAPTDGAQLLGPARACGALASRCPVRR